MKKLLLAGTLLLFSFYSFSQSCTAAGDQISYGSNDVWYGYVYENMNFTGYVGYVQEGSAGNPQFDQSFGGDDVSYSTNGCPVQTQTFSVRYKLQKTFAAGGYQFTVGADDGYRLSVDGGNSWLINRWQDQSYNETSQTIWLDGSYDLVLEFYENGGGNRIRFAYTTACVGSEDPNEYGTGDVWRGYVYDGMSFNNYAGMILEGSPGHISFDQDFGGSNHNFNTSACPVQTETFSVRYRLRKNFPDGNFVFQVGGDDGYRLSLDGGATWVIDRWWDQSYGSSSYSTNLSGWRDLVLEYYENGGDNRISFNVQSNVVLKVDLLDFTARANGSSNELKWNLSADSDPLTTVVQRSNDGRSFQDIQSLASNAGQLNANARKFETIDPTPGSFSYYRLKMQDRDQSWVYSPTVLVNRNGQAAGSPEVFPTRMSGNTTIYIRNQVANTWYQWQLVNMQGQAIDRGRTALLSEGQISSIRPHLQTQPAGWYVLGLISEKGEQFRTKLWWGGAQ